ncbi:Transposase, partial [mine drainage metagenome]
MPLPPSSGPTSSFRGRTFELATYRLGELPLINRFLDRLRLEQVLRTRLPASSSTRESYVHCLLVLLRNLLVAREPLCDVPAWSHPYRPDLLGMPLEESALLNDDRLGRALEALFDTDRASLLTEIVVRAVREFGLELDRFHNDSTTITLQGLYRRADGRTVRGKRTAKAARGHSKDHRPDLKQLLWILTVSA